MKKSGNREREPENSRRRRVLGYARGMITEVAAVAVLTGAALLVMFLIKVIVK